MGRNNGRDTGFRDRGKLGAASWGEVLNCPTQLRVDISPQQPAFWPISPFPPPPVSQTIPPGMCLSRPIRGGLRGRMIAIVQPEASLSGSVEGLDDAIAGRVSRTADSRRGGESGLCRHRCPAAPHQALERRGPAKSIKAGPAKSTRMEAASGLRATGERLISALVCQLTRRSGQATCSPR